MQRVLLRGSIAVVDIKDIGHHLEREEGNADGEGDVDNKGFAAGQGRQVAGEERGILEHAEERGEEKEEKDLVKKAILGLLKEKYGIEEEDFLSAEIEVVPAGPARDYGLDRSMVAGYGHDDDQYGVVHDVVNFGQNV